eukprot:gb/GFBE01074941.1/.p1 GENE.gb/GFBE01074941.1/~~gb/GFBE01074941.1/.p1  ORF type:complete len:434 (+),score=50.79 gb/GFBE01074941.1/:1-1302(+)
MDKPSRKDSMFSFASPSSISTAASTPSVLFSSRDVYAADRKVSIGSIGEASSPLLEDEVGYESDRVPLQEYCRLRLGLSRRRSFQLSLCTAVLVGLVLGMVASLMWLGKLDHFGRLGHLAPPRTSVSRSSPEPASSPRPAPPAPAPPAPAPHAPTVRSFLPLPIEPPPLDRQEGFKRYEVHGRSVWVYQPSPTVLGEAPRKAVMVLHGSEDTPAGIASSSKFHRVAARCSPGFLVVYPEMATPGGEVWGYEAPWEIAFFKDVIELLVSDLSVARDQVFVTGHSAGGSMSLFLQNNQPDLFRAAAAVEAGVSRLPAWTNSSHGRPTLVVWNHNDNVLQQFGGDKLYQQTLDTLRRHDKTGSYPTKKLPLPAGFQGVVAAERLVWQATEVLPATLVVSWASDVPTHTWVNNDNIPGAPLDASILIWDFFQAATEF